MIDVSRWKPIGKSDNADFYEIERGVLAVVPREGARDDEGTATQSVKIQLDYLRPLNQRASVLVFMDPVLDQSAAARKIYRDLPDPKLISCYALVGGSPFGRANSIRMLTPSSKTSSHIIRAATGRARPRSSIQGG